MSDVRVYSEHFAVCDECGAESDAFEKRQYADQWADEHECEVDR